MSSKYSFLDAIRHIERQVKGTNLRYYGAISFDDNCDKFDQWRPFDKFNFILPRYELIKNENRCTFAFNSPEPLQNDPEVLKVDLIKELNDLKVTEDSGLVASAKQCQNLPSKEQWLKSVSTIIDEIKTSDVQKVVLARKKILQMPYSINPFALLSTINSDTFPVYDFCFQVDHGSAFIGSSPECLYRLDGESVYTEALAGTASVTKDSQQPNALKSSSKDLLEQAYVRDDVLDALAEISSEILTDHKPRVVQLKSLQHLLTEYTSKLNSSVGNYEIISSLHPTAAVNGLPRSYAIQKIAESEQFSRGLYAGPIGYIGDADSEFAVAIRSALLQDDMVHLYAGAGLVKSSDPQSEWIETENKLQQFLDILK